MAGSVEDEPLKALVFADHCGLHSATNSPRPASLPMHGASLLLWQLHVLSRGGVAEVLVLSGDPLDDQLPPKIATMTVTILSNPSWRSPGDAIRDIESRVDIRPRNDFVLVQPGALFNVNVGNIVRAHKARCKIDRNWLVSVLFRQGVSFAPRAIAVDEGTGAICYYKEDSSNLHDIWLDTKSENVGLGNGGRVAIFTDVVDIGLDVCSPDILVEFRENFDFDFVRDFIRAKLDGGEAELLGNKMYAHFIDSTIGEYAMRVDTFGAYLAATSDIFDAWMLPITTEAVLQTARKPLSFDQSRNSIVLKDCSSDGDRQESGAPLQSFSHESDWSNVVIGNGVKIDPSVVLRRCVIGNNVQVGAGSVLQESFIGHGSVIGRGVVLHQSILLDSCSIPDNVNIPRGCFFDRKFKLEEKDVVDIAQSSWFLCRANNILSAETLLNGGLNDDDLDFRHSALENDPTPNLDQLGHAYVGVNVLTSNSSRRFDQYLLRSSSAAVWPGFMSEVDSAAEDELEGPATSENNFDSAIDENNVGTDASAVDFYEEVSETISRCHAENVDVETATLEVNSLKLAYERSLSEARIGIVRGIVDIARKSHDMNKLGKSAVLPKLFTRWSNLIKKFSSGGSDEDQRRLVDSLGEYLVKDGLLLKYVLHILYDMDVLDEDVVLGWASDVRTDAASNATKAKLLHDVHDFIDWLENADEEQSSDDNEDDDGDDDDSE